MKRHVIKVVASIAVFTHFVTIGWANELGSSIRVATFNVALNRSASGKLIDDLTGSNNPQARAVAEIIQRVRPDILLLNEFDHDEDGRAIELFQANYLGKSHGDTQPIHFDFVYHGPVNTGLPTGIDLDGDGKSAGPNDSFGFGSFPGQYGMVVLSRFPIVIDQVRTFQTFLWKDMPGSLLPVDYYAPNAAAVLRLSSKSHWDLPVQANDKLLHVLACHPTPPVFDGPEDRNGKRNHDEIRFWADYVDPARSAYVYDDRGKKGGLPENASFVIVGDLNADPFDGDSTADAAAQLIDHPRINSKVIPAGAGGRDAAKRQGQINGSHKGNPEHDTADFPDRSPGNLRIDYVLPSSDCTVLAAEVFWPLSSDPLFRLVGEYDRGLPPPHFVSSDHRLVWMDLRMD